MPTAELDASSNDAHGTCTSMKAPTAGRTEHGSRPPPACGNARESIPTLNGCQTEWWLDLFLARIFKQEDGFGLPCDATGVVVSQKTCSSVRKGTLSFRSPMFPD